MIYVGLMNITYGVRKLTRHPVLLGVSLSKPASHSDAVA